MLVESTLRVSLPLKKIEKEKERPHSNTVPMIWVFMMNVSMEIKQISVPLCIWYGRTP